MSEMDFYERMRITSAVDFDGHTEFHRLTPQERLAWLSVSVQFLYENARELPPRLRPPDEVELEDWRDFRP